MAIRSREIRKDTNQIRIDELSSFLRAKCTSKTNFENHIKARIAQLQSICAWCGHLPVKNILTQGVRADLCSNCAQRWATKIERKMDEWVKIHETKSTKEALEASRQIEKEVEAYERRTGLTFDMG